MMIPVQDAVWVFFFLIIMQVYTPFPGFYILRGTEAFVISLGSRGSVQGARPRLGPEGRVCGGCDGPKEGSS